MKNKTIVVPKILLTSAIAFVILLAFLWIRENGRAMAAEAKLKDLQEKVDTLRNEKNDVTSELQNDVDELNMKLKDAAARYDSLMAQKSDELNKLNSLKEQETADHEAALKSKNDEMSSLETKSKADADKYFVQNKEKNEEISDLGSKLQDVSTKLAGCLKKIQTLEAKDAANEETIAELRSNLKKLEQHNAKLLKTVQSGQERTATLD